MYKSQIGHWSLRAQPNFLQFLEQDQITRIPDRLSGIALTVIAESNAKNLPSVD